MVNFSTGLRVGLDGRRGFFQPECFCDSMILWLKQRTCWGPQTSEKSVIFFPPTIFGTKTFVWHSVAGGSGKKTSVGAEELNILSVNQCISTVGLSAMALAIVVHSERSDTPEVFPWQLIWLITDTCHNESVGLAEGHRMIKTARTRWKEAFLRWKWWSWEPVLLLERSKEKRHMK